MMPNVVSTDDFVIARGVAAWRDEKKSTAASRERWRLIGEALLVGRQENQADRAFKSWCDERGFDMDSATRSDAMWLAKNWSTATVNLPVELTHPKNIRQAQRRLAQEKAATTSKGKPDARGYKTALVRAGLASVDEFRDGDKRREWAATVAAKVGVAPSEISKPSLPPEMYDRIDEACRELAKDRRLQENLFADHQAEVVALPSSSKERLERVIEREKQLLGQNYAEEVRLAADAQIPERIALFEQKCAKADAEFKSYATMRKGIAAQISEQDYRFLLNALHPDREPNREKLTKCFHIVRRLETYIEAGRAS